MSWLGGRDSNRDNVVQSADYPFRSASVRTFYQRFSQRCFGPHRSVPVRPRAVCLTVSQPTQLIAVHQNSSAFTAAQYPSVIIELEDGSEGPTTDS
jgi:hypothetical protein